MIEKPDDINASSENLPGELIEQTTLFPKYRQVLSAVFDTRKDLDIHSFRDIRNERHITTCKDYISKSSVIAGEGKR